MTNQIIGQSLGILATALTALSYQMNTKKSMLTVINVATVSTAMGYLFLGAWSGFALNVVAFLRNAAFTMQKEGTKTAYISAGLFTVAMCAAGVLSWQGPVSLFIIFALAINTVYMSFGNPQLFRKSILITSTLALIYNILVFSIGGIANESIAIISSIIGIIRFKKDKADKDQNVLIK